MFNVEKEEKPSSQNDTLNSSVNGDLDKLNVEKDEITPYEKKYYALFQRCEIIKQSNERLINRIYHVKKLLRRRKKERNADTHEKFFEYFKHLGYDPSKHGQTHLCSDAEKRFLMDRLDGYGDDYKAVATSLFAEMMDDVSPTRSSQGPKNEASVSGALQMDLDL